MRREEVEAALGRAERALEEGSGLRGTGFWRAVGALRADRALAETYAERVGRIDRRAFERGVRARVPVSVGVAGLVMTTAFGIFAFVLSLRAATPAPAEAPFRAVPGVDVYGWPAFVPVAFLVGFVALLLGTHSLTHWIVGRALSIRFTHVFLGGPPPPRPGVKTDYGTYLRASARARAIMHASGAVVTKILPFALLPFAWQLHVDGHWPWLVWILIAVGLLQIVTDVLLSTKTSDWMKVRREMRPDRGDS